jgi:hypothetical protein
MDGHGQTVVFTLLLRNSTISCRTLVPVFRELGGTIAVKISVGEG